MSRSSKQARKRGRPRSRVAWTAACLSAACLSGPGAGWGDVNTPEANPTRVVLITVDTLRADHVGAYGGPVATPNIDRLAREGALLEQACSPMGSTGPAHASLLTGLHPWRHGTLDNAVLMDPRIPTLANLLQQRGVHTAAFVSSYVLHRRFGFHQGFDTYAFEPDEELVFRGRLREKFWSRGERTARSAMQWLTVHTADSFFLWVHLFDPHTPYAPPVGYTVSPQDPVDLTGKKKPVQLEDMAHLERSIRAYRGEVRYADAQVGKITTRLALLGLLDETVVILTADHGEGLGDHGWLEHGVSVFDELIRVPLVVRGPGMPAGRRLAGPDGSAHPWVAASRRPGFDGADRRSRPLPDHRAPAPARLPRSLRGGFPLAR